MPSIAVANEDEWLAVRERYIGGSEVAALFYEWLLPDGSTTILHAYQVPPEGAQILECLGQYTTAYRLFMEKTGALASGFKDNERVQAGKHLEPALAAWSRERWPEWDGKLRKVRRYLTHGDVEGWGASLDYEINEPARPPVEFKNVDRLIFRDQWYSDDEDEGGGVLVPPMHINLQVQAQIGVTSADHGWIVACIGGNSLLRGKVPRHAASQSKLAEAIAAFWQGIATGTPPSLVADYESVADRYRYGIKSGDKAEPLDLKGQGDLPALCRRFHRWKDHAKRSVEVVDNIKGRIAERLGDRDRAITDGFRLTWPVIERAETIVPQRIQTAKTYRGALFVTAIKPPKAAKAAKA